MKKYIRLFILLLVVFSAVTLPAQEKNGEEQADLLHRDYQFEEAIRVYRHLLEQTTDSLKRIALENKIILSENGHSLLDFVSEPHVVAKQAYSKTDFFLHYPGFADSSWMQVPASLAANTSQGEFPVMQFPKGARKIFFSAPDNSGSWNIYSSQLMNDTLWSAPKMLNENITSVGNEFFPVVSPDGKSLYFSSNGHYGVGGYDLYVSHWDEEINDWGISQNLGFPYSSPSNDLLYYNTPDGLYTVFASDRNSSKDSVVVYVLDFDNIPLKKALSPEEVLKIASLPLPGDKKTAEKSPDDSLAARARSVQQDGEYSEYTLAVNQIRELQQKLNEAVRRQKANRELYNTLTNADDLVALEKKIAAQEIETLSLQEKAGNAAWKLQKIEMEFLSKGIFIPETNEDENTADSEKGKNKKPEFTFASHRLGMVPVLMVEEPEPEVDLSFKISDGEAVVLNTASFPDGLVYQIQLFLLSKPVAINALKGLSPVFERKLAGGKYMYSAGIFHSYENVLANLNKVKKAGFPAATITAYKDGKSISIKNARILEKELAEKVVYQVVIDGYAETLPQEVLTAIRSTTEKDIAKALDSGRTKFVIGPFTKMDDAQTLATALKVVSDKLIEVEKVK